MELASIINQYYDSFVKKHGHKLLPSHYNAINAILRCRTPDSGELYVKCPECDHAEWKPVSCGHRSCPKCQNYESTQWIDRQVSKLLPVRYFMVTFTLPRQLRMLTWHYQKKIYSIFFKCVASTLKDFGLTPKNLGAEIGMTMVLHTHSRRLEYHPHTHVVVPGGGFDRQRRQWKKIKHKYLFNEFAIANVFRGRFLSELKNAGFQIPYGVPKKWVADCEYVGKGISAIKYLSKYLYRGVISEKNIIANENGRVTFKYIENETGLVRTRVIDGEDFLFYVIQHVFPKGFRRVRDYGFLHSNAKKSLVLVQLILHVIIKKNDRRERPVFNCPCCKSPMIIIGFKQTTWESG